MTVAGRDPSWEDSPRGKLQRLPEALGHLSSILVREEQERQENTGGGGRRGWRANTDGHLTPPPTPGHRFISLQVPIKSKAEKEAGNDNEFHLLIMRNKR